LSPIFSLRAAMLVDVMRRARKSFAAAVQLPNPELQFRSKDQGAHMKPRYWLLLPALALSHAALAADSADVSPYDSNPACMDRNNSSAGNCVIQSEGTPRHTYRPPGPSSMPGNTVSAGKAAGAGSLAAARGPSSSGHPERGRSGRE
jgi:hypothetical protein